MRAPKSGEVSHGPTGMVGFRRHPFGVLKNVKIVALAMGYGITVMIVVLMLMLMVPHMSVSVPAHVRVLMRSVRASAPCERPTGIVSRWSFAGSVFRVQV